MVPRTPFGSQDHRLAHQVFDHRFHSSVVEEITHSKAAAHLRNLNRGASLPADVLECSVALIHEQTFRLEKFGRHMSTVHLWIHMPVDQKEILPTIIVEIDKGLSPAHI